MGRRARQRAAIAAPTSDYLDGAGNRLRLRGSLTPATRLEYAAVRSGERLAPAARAEDAWQRAVEFLFERLAVEWVLAGAPITRQRELLARFRAASPDERGWIRAQLRAHCAEHFPDLDAP